MQFVSYNGKSRVLRFLMAIATHKYAQLLLKGKHLLKISHHQTNCKDLLASTSLPFSFAISSAIFDMLFWMQEGDRGIALSHMRMSHDRILKYKSGNCHVTDGPGTKTGTIRTVFPGMKKRTRTIAQELKPEPETYRTSLPAIYGSLEALRAENREEKSPKSLPRPSGPEPKKQPE